jgi:3-oxoacyl-[acyl-carrier protein] reductase
VVLADINEVRLDKTSSEISSTGGRAVGVPVDVSSRDSWRKLLETSLKEFGQVDVLINCAGVIHPGPIEGLSDENLKRQVNVNFLGVVYGTQVFLPHFIHRNKGHLIHIASLGGIVPLPGEAVYSATKFAVRGFCLALALELRQTPIHVSVICPDSVETAQLREEAFHNGSSMSFTGSLLQPSDVARAIVRTVIRPRREVLVPRLRGWPAKVGGLSPNLMSLLYPILDKAGQRGRLQFLKKLQTQLTANS